MYYCLVGLRWGVLLKSSSHRFQSCFHCGWFSRSSHTSGWKIATHTVALPGTWRYRVTAGTGRPSVSILWLGKIANLICSFYLSVAAHTIVCADPYHPWDTLPHYLSVAAHTIVQIRPWDTLPCCWDIKQPTNNYICPSTPFTFSLSLTHSLFSPFSSFPSPSASPSALQFLFFR